MSMIGNFLLISDEELERILTAPHTVHDLIDAVYEGSSDDLVDIDKAWHCLHFLLTGTAWEGEPPLNFIVCGGREVGEEEVGYGPARGFASSELRSIAEALDRIEYRELARRFDSARMDELEIYPSVGSWREVDPNSEETFGYYSGAFDALKDLTRRGRDTGHGLLVWLS